MILVDTSIWIDHLHATEPRLVELLGDDQVGSHPWVITELALGSISQRSQVLSLVANLWSFPTLTPREVLSVAERHRLWSRGLSTVDVHLLGAVALTPGGHLWTRDKRLSSACQDLNVDTFDDAS